MSDGPVFIGGLAFSGKTPLRIALSAHSNLSLTRRTAMWSTYDGRFGDLAQPGNLERCLSRMLADPAIAALEPDRSDIVRRFSDGPATYPQLFAVIHQQHAERRGKQRWGDQLGMIEQRADVVLSSLPTARMIHMIRDPRSRYRAAAGRHRQLPGKLGWETARWRHSAELALRNRRRFGDRYHVLRYEQLATDPEPTLRAVCAFIGEAYEPAMLAALRGTTLHDPASLDDPPGHGRDPVAAFVERHAGRQLRAYDYAVTGGGRGRALSPSFYLIALPCNRAGIAAWRLARSTRRGALEAA